MCRSAFFRKFFSFQNVRKASFRCTFWRHLFQEAICRECSRGKLVWPRSVSITIQEDQNQYAPCRLFSKVPAGCVHTMKNTNVAAWRAYAVPLNVKVGRTSRHEVSFTLLIHLLRFQIMTETWRKSPAADPELPNEIGFCLDSQDASKVCNAVVWHAFSSE